MNVIDVLEERGFVEQKTHEEELRQLFEDGPVTCYIGFDPTASSLHIAHEDALRGSGSWLSWAAALIKKSSADDRVGGSSSPTIDTTVPTFP